MGVFGLLVLVVAGRGALLQPMSLPPATVVLNQGERPPAATSHRSDRQIQRVRVLPGSVAPPGSTGH